MSFTSVPTLQADNFSCIKKKLSVSISMESVDCILKSLCSKREL